MEYSLTPGRADAVRALQRRRSKHLLDSFDWHVADHAIDFAMSPRRPEGRYLAKDALRNAKHVIAKRKRRLREREVELLAPDGLELAASVQADATYLAHLPPDPEDALLWKDAYARMACAVSRRRHGRAVLEAWRHGDDVRETADAIGISDRHVKTERAVIRNLAISLIKD